MEETMRRGDLIRLIDSFNLGHRHPGMFKAYIVRGVEPSRDWVFVFGKQGPIQASLMEVISEY